MTTRNRSRTSEPEVVAFDRYLNGVLNGSTAQNAWIREETMSDVVTPGYHSRVAAGEIINNAMTYSSKTRSFDVEKQADIHYAYYIYTDAFRLGGNWTSHFLDNVYMPFIGNPSPKFDSGEKSDIMDTAQLKCLAGIDPTPYAFFEDLGEIMETIRFIRNPTLALTRLIKTFVAHKRSLNGIRNVWERTQAIADLWKQYRFAAAPLVRSMIDAMELLSQKEPTRPKRRTSHGRSYSNLKSLVPTVYRPTPIGKVYEYWASGEYSYDAHATVLYEIDNPLVDWFWKTGLRKKDIIPTMWELFPYSFMIDRLLYVLGTLKGLMNFLDPSVTFHCGSTTSKTLSTYRYSLVDWQDSAYDWITMGDKPDEVLFEDFDMERQPWSPNVFTDLWPSLTPAYLTGDLTSFLDLLSILIGLLPAGNSAWE